MKICWDNLEKLEYKGHGIWRKVGTCTYFVYKEHCKSCGESFLAQNQSKGVCCDKSCAASLIHKKIRIENICKNCNKKFEVIPSRKTTAFFCSKECYSEWQSENLKGKNSPSWKGNFIKIICKQCGNLFEIPLYRKETASFCSIKCMSDWMSYHLSGSNGPGWKGGVTPENKLLRRQRRYFKWRLLIFERDNYTCQMCNKHGIYLNAHHIKRFIDYPEFRFDVDNGITLCVDCHKKTLYKEEHFEQQFKNIIRGLK